MSKLIVSISVVANIILLIFSYIVIDDVHFRMNRWGSYWQENMLIISIFAGPASSLALVYLAIKEHWLECLKLSIERRKLEGKRKVFEEKKRISELEGK